MSLELNVVVHFILESSHAEAGLLTLTLLLSHNAKNTMFNLKRNSWGLLGPQRDEIVIFFQNALHVDYYLGIREGPGVLKDPKVLLCDFFDGFV